MAGSADLTGANLTNTNLIEDRTTPPRQEARIHAAEPFLAAAMGALRSAIASCDRPASNNWRSKPADTGLTLEAAVTILASLGELTQRVLIFSALLRRGTQEPMAHHTPAWGF